MNDMNMTVKDLREIVAGLPDEMDVIIPVGIEEDANYIVSFRHVRTAGILVNPYEQGPALCLNSSENGIDISTQIEKLHGYTNCNAVLF